MQKMGSGMLQKPVVRALCSFVVMKIIFLSSLQSTSQKSVLPMILEADERNAELLEGELFEDVSMRPAVHHQQRSQLSSQLKSELGERSFSRQAQREKLDSKKPLPAVTVARYLADAGFPPHAIPKMVCTALYESSFRPGALNRNRNGSQDTGLFQINDVWLKECGVTRTQLLNPQVNSECALRVYQEHGMKAWYAYKKKRLVCNSFRVPTQVAVN